MGWIVFGIFLGIVGIAANFVITAFINDSNEYAIKNGNAQKVKVNKPVMIASFIIPVLLMTAVASSTRVGTGEIAVMTRFGKVTGQELGEGLHFKSPFDKANIYDIKVVKEEATAPAASKDLQDVKGNVAVNYAVEAGKVSELHKTVGPLFKEKVIDPAIQEVFKRTTSEFDATQLITERAKVKDLVVQRLRERLNCKNCLPGQKPLGIVVHEVSIVNLEFSPEFTRAIESKQVAQQEAQRAVFIKEKATQEAAAEIERARGQAESQRLLSTTATEESIELKKLEVQRYALEKWNGVLPTTSAGSGTDFLLNVGR